MHRIVHRIAFETGLEGKEPVNQLLNWFENMTNMRKLKRIAKKHKKFREITTFDNLKSMIVETHLQGTARKS